jgi:methionyl-tRNA synthetase
MTPKTFYITTPIYYPNGEPHLGHVYTTLATDTIARFRRLAGFDVRFLTGTDEHGIKMVKTAEAAGITPADLAYRNAEIFRSLWRELNVTNDDFIRTSEPRHKTAVQEIVRRLVESGDIYLGGYEGWYDEGQEEFVTENEAKKAEYKSVISGRPLVRYKEPSYFFKLSKWAPQVQAHIEANPQFIQPESRRNEVLSKLKMGVEDLSISRATLSWGIPLPNDPSHVVYVWIDALSNYITALGYPEPSSSGTNSSALFHRYWPADVHLIGKEILWFHTVYWPAMLFALGLPAPKQVFAHGWWTAEGKKMSKTLGNFVDIEKLRAVIGTYGEDALRFYLLRAAPFGSDLDWKADDFAKSYNELGNVVGNLLNRVVNMTTRYRNAAIPAVGVTDAATDAVVTAPTDAFPTELAKAYDTLALQQAAVLPVELARAANGYIDTTAPFKLAKDPAQAARLDTVLNLSAQAVYRALVGLLPVLPEKAKAGLSQLGVSVEGKTLADLFAAPLPAGHAIGEGKVLFPKVETKA